MQLAALLSVAGRHVERPLFVGFLPKKKGHQTLLGRLRRALEEEIADGIVLYESPERIVALLGELLEWEMPLHVVLGRELTKKFEEILRGSAGEVRDTLAARPGIKGEISLLVTKL